MHPRILNLSRSAGAGALFRNVPDRRKGVDRIDLPDTLSERGLLRVLQITLANARKDLHGFQRTRAWLDHRCLWTSRPLQEVFKAL